MSKLLRGSGVAAALVAALTLSLVVAGPAGATTPGNVTGTITASGSPVANIAVSWIEPATEAFDTVQTAADGTYTLPLPTGTTPYYLAVNANAPDSTRVDTSYLALFFGASNSESYAYQTLAPHTSRSSYALNVTMKSGGSVSGTSANLANSHINLVPVDGSTDAGPYADASGNFSFTGYTPGVYQLYAPAHGVFAAYRSAPFTLDDGDAIVIDPTLSVGGSIQGTITAAVPIEDVRVTVTGGDIIGDDPIFTTPDASGNYSVGGLSNGTYTVTVGNYLGSGEYQFVDQTFMVHIVLGQTVTHDVALVQGATINLTVPTSADPNTSFAFCLYDSAGTLIQESDRTGGSFSFLDVAPGTYTLDVADDPATGYSSQQLTVTAGQTLNMGSISLTTKPVSVSGVVSGGHSGFIRFGQESASFTENFGTQASFGTNGRYTATGLLPGKYDVYVFSTGRQRTHYTITISASKKANYAIGSPLVPFRGKLLIDGSPFQQGELTYFDSAEDELTVSITNGALSSSGQAGTYVSPLPNFWSEQADFQQNSPFFIIWPTALKTLKLVSGHTTNVGTQSLKVGGAG